MANVNTLLLLFDLYMFVTFTHSLKTSFECNGTELQYQYREIFSLSLHIDNISIALMNRGSAPEPVPNRVANVSDLTGAWTEDKVNLQGLLGIDCKMAPSNLCEFYGYVSNTGDYKHQKFAPILEFKVGIINSSIAQRTLQANPQEVVITCTAIVGSNRTKVSWQSHVDGQKYSIVEDRFYNVVWTVLPHCKMMLESRMTYAYTKGQGSRNFRCMYGETEVGSILVVDEIEGPSTSLPTHLFLSSMVLVYAHFVIIPVICAILHKRKLIGDFRNPGNEKMRYLRGFISCCVAIVFAIWWISVINIHSHGEYASYLVFFLIDSFFLFLYATIRLLSHCLEKPRDRHLYNGRVALSCGAVITPSICWIMIKSQQNIPLSGLECFWWIVTVMSLGAFVFVSHDRELKAWEKDQ